MTNMLLLFQGLMYCSLIKEGSGMRSQFNVVGLLFVIVCVCVHMHAHACTRVHTWRKHLYRLSILFGPHLFKVLRVCVCVWGDSKTCFPTFSFGNNIHLLWVSADVWVGADSTAVELVLAAGPKELEIKRLVIVADIERGEVYSQSYLSVWRHNPPEVIQPETTTQTSKVTMGIGTGELPGTGPVQLGLGMAGCKAPLRITLHFSGGVTAVPLTWGSILPLLCSCKAYLVNFSWECSPSKLFWSRSDIGAMLPDVPPERPFLPEYVRRFSF